MPLPPGLSTVTVTGTYKHPDGTPLIGRVIFRPEPEILTSATYGTLVLGTVEGVLDTTGTFTVTLLATDDTDVTPTGWTYRVTERWYDTVGRDYPIALPQTAPNVDIADITPTAPTVGTYIVVTGPAGPAGPTGPKGDQGDPGGGSTIRTTDARIIAGDVTLPSAGSWAIVTSGSTQLAAAITAAVGDRIQASPSFMRSGGGSFLDLAILTDAGAISRYFGTDSATPLTEGHPSYYPQASSFPGVPGAMQIVVGAGEVDINGKATIALAYRGTGGETIYASTTYPFYLLLTNLGPEPA